jgi:hypothetical protein
MHIYFSNFFYEKEFYEIVIHCAKREVQSFDIQLKFFLGTVKYVYYKLRTLPYVNNFQ